MRIYKLPALSETNNSKEYCLGCDDLDTNAVYVVYGRLSREETERAVAPLKGHEAILYLVKGEISVSSASGVFSITCGEAFHLKEGESVILENRSDKESIYTLSGGNAKPNEVQTHPE
jgi:redox-sensitive bicupin YhaK (pirin superfamily)